MSNYTCSHCGNPAVVSATAVDGYTGHYCTACYGELPESHVHHWRNIRHRGEQPSPWTGLALLACIFGLLVITVLYS